MYFQVKLVYEGILHAMAIVLKEKSGKRNGVVRFEAILAVSAVCTSHFTERQNQGRNNNFRS